MFAGPTPDEIRRSYDAARRAYQALGVDSDRALDRLAGTPISLQCWQGDDVRGFENGKDVSGGGILATGSYPGPATDADMLRSDAGRALALIPGRKRFNLHAIYAETGGRDVPRDRIGPEHFRAWMKWSRENGVPLDFNPTYFAHPLADDGRTLSSGDEDVRGFWVRHGIACRRIAEAMARNQACPCIVNHWIPDGDKDQPMDRLTPRRNLLRSLDEIFAAGVDPELCRDALESKLFGLGSEDYVVGSHEFYLGYALRHPQMICFDMGHFHPTETIHDKLSAVMLFKDEMLLHLSRSIRWDSDHVVNFTDDLRNVFQQLVRCGLLDRTHLALDFFDAGINRIGAWVVGMRSAQKALLAALLEPGEMLRGFEEAGDGAMKLALLEELKTYPLGAVWDMFCLDSGTPAGSAWIDDLIDIDRNIVRRR